MSIKIPVSADFDSSQIEAQLQQFRQQLNSLGQQIAQANKVQFNPIGRTTVDDLRKVTAQFEALKRVSGDLNKRINATGQKGAGFFDLDWGKMYPDQHSRSRQMAKSYEYVTGIGLHSPIPPGPGQHRPRQPSGGSTVGGMAVNAAQAGLRGMSAATGGAGGVAAGALGTGMSAGFGAGLMGLVGGLVALGIGKVVGAATEKMGEAEDNAVAYDKLKRVLGDVNVAFVGLKSAVMATADANHVTYKEAAKLSTEFAKLGNLSGDQYKTMGGEVGMGIGLSRGYGLDPTEGVGLLGRMRGVGVTRNEQDTKRFALLIGETIGKSGAFAKADEVMAAIGDYATMQTRNTLGSVNVGGYAGMFAGLVGSGIPGLDPTGAGSMLSRINSTLSMGGGKGEASQYFTGMVGRGMGLDPIQTQILREGGAFATNDEAFGPGSVAARYGLSGPGGGKTFLQGSLDALRGSYGSNKGLLAQATANHLGINMRQAMGLLSVDPAQMGEMEKYGDMTKLSGSGISSMSKALFGSESDRASLADSLYRRTGAGALNTDELAKLDRAFPQDGSGNAEVQKSVLAELIASRDQESTQGKDIRDSKNAIDNIKTNIADKLIPLTQEMRHGIMKIAGVGVDGQTSESIMKGIVEAESKARVDSLTSGHRQRLAEISERRGDIQDKLRTLSEDKLVATYHDRPDILEAKRKERGELEKELTALAQKRLQLEEEQAKQLEKENAWKTKQFEELTTAAAKRREQEVLASEQEENRRKRIEASAAADEAANGPGRFKPSGGSGRTGTIGAIDGGFAAEAAAEGLSPSEARLAYSIYSQESSGGRNTATSHAGAQGHMQMLPATFKAFADEGWDINNPSHNRRAAMRYIKYLNQKSGGNLRSTAGGYYGGEKAIRPDGSLKTYGDRRNPSYPNTQEYADEVIGRMDKIPEGTPLPGGGSGGPGNDQRFIFDAAPIEVIHKNERGEPIGQPEQLATRVRSNFYRGHA